MTGTGTTWSVTRTRLDGPAGSPFEWQSLDQAWPSQQDAEDRAQSGSLVFSKRSDFLEPHPTIAGALLVIERFFVFLVYPIRDGDQDRCRREAIDGVPADWLESLRPTDGGRLSDRPRSGSQHLDQMMAGLEAIQPGNEGTITPEVQAAHEALYAQSFESRNDDSVIALWRAAGPAYRGVAYAFFRNIIEYKFTGTEHRLAIERYLRGLVNFNPPAMQGTDIPLMARFIVDQTGDGRPRLGRTNITGLDLDTFLDTALAVAVAIGSFEGLTANDFKQRLLGATARYQMGMG